MLDRVIERYKEVDINGCRMSWPSGAERFCIRAEMLADVCDQ